MIYIALKNNILYAYIFFLFIVHNIKNMIYICSK